MLKWELKKIIREKINIIGLLLMIILFLQIGFIKPMLETQNEYFDEVKNEYIIDSRSKDVIANEKLNNKVNEIKEISELVSSDKNTKELSKMSQEKLKLDNGSYYKDVSFYKVISQRVDFASSILIMIIIIVMISSNLYVEEEISNVSPIILSSKKKNKVLYSKLTLAILLPIIIYGLYIIGTVLITFTQYGKPLNGHLQAYRIIDIATMAKAITINNYVIIKIITTVLILIGISLFSLLSSFISDNSVKSIGISILFIAIGKILTMFKFLPAKILFLISASNYIDVIMGSSKISGLNNGYLEILSRNFDISNLCIGIYVIIILIGLLGNVYCIRKFLTK